MQVRPIVLIGSFGMMHQPVLAVFAEEVAVSRRHVITIATYKYGAATQVHGPVAGVHVRPGNFFRAPHSYLVLRIGTQTTVIERYK